MDMDTELNQFGTYCQVYAIKEEMKVMTTLTCIMFVGRKSRRNIKGSACDKNRERIREK